MKGFSDKLTQYTLTRELTEFDRRLLGALAQGYEFERARFVEGAKRGVSERHARRLAKQALIKCNIDISKIPDNPARWCYENAYLVSKKVGRRYLEMEQHNDLRQNRQDRGFCLDVLGLALDGVRRPELCRRFGVGPSNLNAVLAQLRRLLVECYLQGAERDLASEFWHVWQRVLGYARHKAIMRQLRAQWRPHERLREFHRRKLYEARTGADLGGPA